MSRRLKLWHRWSRKIYPGLKEKADPKHQSENGLRFGLKTHLAEIALNGTSNERSEHNDMKPDIELTEKNRGSEVTILNALLADEFVLGARIRNYHCGHDEEQMAFRPR